MEVILLENIINLGKIGDQVKVKNGYGRNFLLPEGKALRANKENVELVNKKKFELNKKNDETKLKFKEIANKIKNKILKFNKEAKENGELYGSIKPKEVSNYFVNNLKVEINPSEIDLRQEINKIGSYKININLHSEVSTNVTLVVDKIESI
ncbi:MAG: 50S ribosomal protein L9 [Candidatus Pelagibacter sp. TMED106]|nr:MAG: 50S ribosomal protein L9 [Candidatus Pelagibacter sp. TMED106]|tara:strand:+ start:456 stop:911 length:456 start_codon:yes stop_codon:yes gene_type:complete